jgi:hypothetical protein
MLATWLRLASPNPELPEGYFTRYMGQFQGLKDTLVEFEVQFFEDEACTLPLSRLYKTWIQIDRHGNFESDDLKFYTYPHGLKEYWTKGSMAGMRLKLKARVIRGCGSFE